MSRIENKKSPPFIVKVVSGKFLRDKRLIKYIPFLAFVYGLVIVYIATGYYAEDLVKKINKTDNEVKELRSEFISIKSELMQISKQTTLANVLNQQNTGIKESIIPPKKITPRK